MLPDYKLSEENVTMHILEMTVLPHHLVSCLMLLVDPYLKTYLLVQAETLTILIYYYRIIYIYTHTLYNIILSNIVKELSKLYR